MNKNQLQQAIIYFGFTDIPKIQDLKREYRLRAKLHHPDIGGDAAVFRDLTFHYDFLAQYATADQSWLSDQHKNLRKWEKTFKDLWRTAYRKSCRGKPDDGLHFLTCIDTYSRSYIYPPSHWFAELLFGGNPSAEVMADYRSHLLKIAPNSKMRESYAKKYWELEFERSWIFYLPPSKKPSIAFVC